MSNDNIELAKQGFAALKERGVEGLLEFVHPDFETTTSPELASEPDTYRGHEGVRRYFDAFGDAMENVYFEGRNWQAVGEDTVVADVTLHATGRTTGIDVAQDSFMVWRVKDRKAIMMVAYPDRESALAAARRD